MKVEFLRGGGDGIRGEGTGIEGDICSGGGEEMGGRLIANGFELDEEEDEDRLIAKGGGDGVVHEEEEEELISIGGVGD